MLVLSQVAHLAVVAAAPIGDVGTMARVCDDDKQCEKHT